MPAGQSLLLWSSVGEPLPSALAQALPAAKIGVLPGGPLRYAAETLTRATPPLRMLMDQFGFFMPGQLITRRFPIGTPEVIAQAQRFPGQERQVLEFYGKNAELKEQLRAPIFEEKTVDFILELAKVSEKSVTPEELLKAAREAEEEEPAEKAAN